MRFHSFTLTRGSRSRSRPSNNRLTLFRDNLKLSTRLLDPFGEGLLQLAEKQEELKNVSSYPCMKLLKHGNITIESNSNHGIRTGGQESK